MLWCGRYQYLRIYDLYKCQRLREIRLEYGQDECPYRVQVRIGISPTTPLHTHPTSSTSLVAARLKFTAPQHDIQIEFYFQGQFVRASFCASAERIFGKFALRLGEIFLVKMLCKYYFEDSVAIENSSADYRNQCIFGRIRTMRHRLLQKTLLLERVP